MKKEQTELEEAIGQVSKKMPQAAVDVFPSGGNIIPEVRQNLPPLGTTGS